MRPTTADVMVAIAGMIFPAISLLCKTDSGHQGLLFRRKWGTTEGPHEEKSARARVTGTSQTPHYLMPVCRGNVRVFSPEVGCCHNEIHVKVAVIIL